MNLTALHLKLALLSYYRYKRQWVCVDEFNGADVIVDTGSEVYEIEVKVDKQDLMKGEDKKCGKHNSYRHGFQWRWCHPNRYYFCVPTSLREDAEKKIKQLNPKYGLILFDEDRFDRFRPTFLEDLIVTVQRAGKLHEKYTPGVQRKIAKRASSKLITLMRKEYEKATQECQDSQEQITSVRTDGRSGSAEHDSSSVQSELA